MVFILGVAYKIIMPKFDFQYVHAEENMIKDTTSKDDGISKKSKHDNIPMKPALPRKVPISAQPNY
jgi:hypothetical protein